VDKGEFMCVSGLEGMGLNEEYVGGEEGDEFIIYKFGDDYMGVYNSELEMKEELNELKEGINLTRIEAYE
ncbi:DUF4930 family protein, partial [Staphylococcus epidermidis]|uniref:DUF4930 family protein n=1 Tax=Staphylococcus epidermidis TaxID=1282 RepID=UPI0011A651A6